MAERLYSLGDCIRIVKCLYLPKCTCQLSVLHLVICLKSYISSAIILCNFNITRSSDQIVIKCHVNIAKDFCLISKGRKKAIKIYFQYLSYNNKFDRDRRPYAYFTVSSVKNNWLYFFSTVTLTFSFLLKSLLWKLHHDNHLFVR